MNASVLVSQTQAPSLFLGERGAILEALKGNRSSKWRKALKNYNRKYFIVDIDFRV